MPEAMLDGASARWPFSHAGWLGGAPRVHTAPPTARSRAARLRDAASVSLMPFMGVVAYWWAATGLIVAMQRDGLTHRIGAAVSTALGLLGVWLVVRSRDEATPGGARRGFLGGALLWGWVSVALYGGWIVGPAARQVQVPAEAPSIGFAWAALQAIGYHEAASAALLVLTWWLTRGRVNRTGFWSLLAFWAVQMTAKINVFLGVENPGGRFLPEKLWFLQSYFGPPHHGAMLPLTLAVLVLAMLYFVLLWLRHPAPWLRQAGALLATLMGLAVLEHMLLGISVDVPLWDMFLRSRGY
jgi:putative photosynthetic complex assembly protein 2